MCCFQSTPDSILMIMASIEPNYEVLKFSMLIMNFGGGFASRAKNTADKGKYNQRFSGNGSSKRGKAAPELPFPEHSFLQAGANKQSEPTPQEQKP